ncbi:MAG: SH3 domain-containing protein [Chloroflexota bacterium]
MQKTGHILKLSMLFFILIVVLFSLSDCNLPVQKVEVPKDPGSMNIKTTPVITSINVENNCNIRINYIDDVTYSGATVYLKRQIGEGNKFNSVQVAIVHGAVPASFLEEGLSSGTYTYLVGYFDNSGFYDGKNSSQVVLPDNCGSEPLAEKPFNPLVYNVEISNSCNVMIEANIFGNALGGVRIYRSTSGSDFVKIDELSLSEWLGGKSPPPQFTSAIGKYYDRQLHTGKYRYKLSTFNAKSEVFSDSSAEQVITDTVCDPKLDTIHTTAPIITSTPTLLPLPEPIACTWEAVINVFIRKGPSSSQFSDITGVVPGTRYPILGQSEDGQFWVVEVKTGVNGYVPKSEKFSKTSGDCSNQPVLQDPKLPPTAVPTITPTIIPQCSDGIDNDRDRLVDMRDPGCSSPRDNSER